MKKSNEVKLEAFSQLDDEIIGRNAEKRQILLKNVHAGNRKLITVIAIAATFAILLSTLSIILVPMLSKQVPVYRGMTVSNSPAIPDEALHASHLVKPLFDAKKEDSGYVDGDYNKKPDEIDQDEPFKEDKVPLKNGIGKNLVVEGAAKELYYANANEDVFITVHIDNPDSYEILSFTLNGYKYQNNMFEYGSDLENLILKVNVGDVEGIIDYTIDAIKYIDGDKIKDVRMAGDKTVKIGIATDKQPTATLSDETVGFDSVSFTASINDTLSLIEKQSGTIHAILYDGETIVSKKELTLGEHTVTFTGLSENTLYQYAIVATYDRLDGAGIDSHILAAKAFMTKSSAPLLFDSVVLSGTSASFAFLWNEGVTPGSITALSLWQGENKLRDLAVTDTSVSDLLWGTDYLLRAEYTAAGKSDSIEITFRTVAKAEPSVTLSKLTIGRTSVSFSLVWVDPDRTGEITRVSLYKGETLVQESDSLTNVLFSLLEGDTEYTVQVTYTFDLGDGKGKQTKTYEERINTKPLFENGICLNDNGVTYKLNGDGTVSITAYNGTATDLTLSLAGYTVTAIEAEVFRGATTLQTVTLPDTLLTIGDSAFAACSSLEYIIIPDSVISIGYFAFSGCTSMTGVFSNLTDAPKSWDANWLGEEAKAYFKEEWEYIDSIPVPLYRESEGLKIESTFLGYVVTGIGSFHDSILVIPSEYNGQPVVAIDSRVFAGCDFIETVVIPGSITMTLNSFDDCTNLKRVIIEKGGIFDSDAFSGCTSLQEINFKGDITESIIAELNPQNFPSLSRVTLSPDDPNYYLKDGAVYSKKDVTFVAAIPGIEKLVLPEGITSIDANACRDYMTLKEVVLPSTLKSIGTAAFFGCTSLAEIIIPEGVTSIGDGAFADCTFLEYVVIPESVTSIGFNAFYGCTSLTVFCSSKYDITTQQTMGTTSIYWLGEWEMKDGTPIPKKEIDERDIFYCTTLLGIENTHASLDFVPALAIIIESENQGIYTALIDHTSDTPTPKSQYTWVVSINGQEFPVNRFSLIDNGDSGYVRMALEPGFSFWNYPINENNQIEFRIRLDIYDQSDELVYYVDFTKYDPYIYTYTPITMIPDQNREEQNLSFLPVDKILSVETDIIPIYSEEDITSIWDDQVLTKFCTTENGDIIFTLTSARRIRGISLVNANDNEYFPGRTLVSFEVYGSNDKLNWTPLHSQTGTADDQISASTNYLERYYELSSNGVYQYYKLVPKNDGMWQASELYLVYAESDSEN